MQPQLAGELGVEGDAEDTPLRGADHAPVVERCNHPCRWSHRRDLRCADEYRLQHSSAPIRTEATHRELRLERLELAAEGVAPHGHIDAAHGFLVGPGVLDPVGERREATAEDDPDARAKVGPGADGTLEPIEGGRLDTAAYKGKVVLLVNTASFCGFTGQYKDLEALWRKYKDRGLVLLGVPANDFGAQEPGSNAEIKKFCEANFDVSFPLADKQVVIGAQAHPLYKWAAQQTGPLGVPTWNFHKILIGRDGRVIDWFTAMSGVGDKLEQAIEKALAVQGS